VCRDYDQRVMTTQAATEYRVPRTLDTARAWLASGRRQATVALALYVVISIGYFGLHVLPHLGRETVGLRDWTDPTVNIWSLAWWPYAVLHGLNPLVTHALFPPDRIDLAATSPTLCPLAGIVGAPITIAFGPIVSYNVLMLASPVLAAFFTFLLCRYITGNFVASLFGGYVFGFSTYILGHMEGHLQLVFIFPIPAAVHLVLRLIDGRISERRFIALMALLLGALFLTASEITLTFVVLGAVALGVTFVLAPTEREHIIGTAKPILAAGVAAMIVTSPVIYYELHGIVRFGSNIGDIDGSDALGFVVPPNLVRLGRTHFAALSQASNISGSDAEAVTYVGLPLALIVARYTITRWRLTATRILFAMLAIVIVLLLGSRLHIAGYPTIPLPWKLLDQWVLRDVIPLRLAVYLFLIVAVILAMWLAEPRAGSWGLAKWAAAVASIAFLVPNVSAGLWRGQEYNPGFFTTHEYRSVLTRGETVLILPFGQLGDSMLWQADTDMWFRLAGGYINPVYPADYERDPLFPALFRNARPDPQTLRSFLDRRHVGAVIVDPEIPQRWPEALAALGLKRMSLGGVWFYRS
jgi:hypothetical protein